jgi:serine/threonine-protein kinase
VLKVMSRAAAADDEAVRRFFEVTRAESHVTHRAVLRMTDSGASPDGVIYAVYEDQSGEPLRALMTRAHRLAVPVAASIARQAAEGLAAAGEHELLHRSLSPESVIVSERAGYDAPEVKVFGFGGSYADNGVIYYQAPETLISNAGDRRSDIYSLGVVLYEMLAGEPPFAAATAEELKQKIENEVPPPLSAFRADLPASLGPVVLKAISPDPENRYQTASEFAADLDSISASGSSLAAAAEAPNNLWKTAFVVLAGITLLSAFLIYATSNKRTDPATALQPDANGQPVQPINPATGAEEQNLTSLPLTADGNINSNMAVPPGTLPGGDGYNPWATGAPPPGAPSYPAGGQTVTIDPNNPSPFMRDSGCIMQPSGILLCPAPLQPPANTTARPTPTPRTPPANANTAPAASPTPAAAKPSPTPGRPARPSPTPRARANANSDEL